MAHLPKKKSRRASASVLPSSPSPSRDVVGAAARQAGPGYPRIAELRGQGGILPLARSLAEKFLLAGAAAGLAAVGSGCAPPSCQPTRLDEVRVHGDTALSEVGSFQIQDAVHELGVGLGVTPHPVAMPMAGAMVAVLPPPPPEEDAGVPSDDAGTAPPTEDTAPPTEDTAPPTSGLPGAPGETAPGGS